MWRKGQTHLDTFWKLLFDEYVLNLREGTEKHLELPGHNPQHNLLKETFYLLRKIRHEVTGIWPFQVQAGKSKQLQSIKLSAGKLLNRTLNCLFALECATQRETLVKPSRSKYDQYDASQQRGGQKFTNERPVHEAAIKARQAPNKLLNM